MAGPYVHLILVHQLLQKENITACFPTQSEFSQIAESFAPYVLLGAVAPDYPNLGVATHATHWADIMHCTQPAMVISNAVAMITNSCGAARCKQVAWLMGYCSHLAADMTIHPVVQAKVGSYSQNRVMHRVCEMHQDSYVHRRMDMGEIDASDIFARMVAMCGINGNQSELDPVITSLWEKVLAEGDKVRFTEDHPDITGWHREFITLISDTCRNPRKIFPLAALISRSIDKPYPNHREINFDFVNNLTIPLDEPLSLHYDKIFERASGNIMAIWKVIESCFVTGKPQSILSSCTWNLDNGRDDQGRLVLWEKLCHKPGYLNEM